MPQSLSDILLHLIFGTKHREALIAAEIEPELYGYMVAIFDDLGCLSLRINGAPDHVHALFRLSRTAAVSEVVESVKKGTSRWIKARGPRYAAFAWQQGYGVFSVSESNADQVKRYIEDQKEHHRARSFQDEYRAFLRRHGIAFDERYVRD